MPADEAVHEKTHALCSGTELVRWLRLIRVFVDGPKMADVKSGEEKADAHTRAHTMHSIRENNTSTSSLRDWERLFAAGRGLVSAPTTPLRAGKGVVGALTTPPALGAPARSCRLRSLPPNPTGRGASRLAKPGASVLLHLPRGLSGQRNQMRRSCSPARGLGGKRPLPYGAQTYSHQTSYGVRTCNDGSSETKLLASTSKRNCTPVELTCLSVVPVASTMRKPPTFVAVGYSFSDRRVKVGSRRTVLITTTPELAAPMCR